MGSCAVVLWGPPGSGKTHLAREYLWRHRADFQSGISWIDCRSEESIYKSFWEIAQAAVLLGAADVSERGRDWDGVATFVEAVRKWFESKEGWLIVFDGVTFDSEIEIQAFMKFIPDSKGNSIIFTSVDRTLAKRQRLLYPAAVKVSPLSVNDARRLLYKGLDIKNPTPAQEAKATELVKYYECLPLAIHAAGHVLTAKGKALEKFHVGSYPTSKRLAEPYAEIMQDLRENFHHEAIRLINLLGFFSHSVPVAMLQLGRRALKGFNVEIRSTDREGSTCRDLETTIATLIKYGMVERTLRCYNVEQTDSRECQPSLITTGGDSSPELTQESIREDAIAKRPESSLESSSTRSTMYSIDILQVHTVVQGFCRDELRLKDRERYWWWLIVAVELFCLSYFSADERIRAPGGQGLVRDYREYETHAARLYSHFPKDKHAASIDVQRARHKLRRVIRAIKREIENRSPSQSFRSARQEVQISIFEHTSSTSSDGPETPMSTPSRSSTLAQDLQSKSESPTQIENGYRGIISGAAESGEVSSEEDYGYLSGFDDSMMSSIVTERRRSIPELPTASSAENLERPHNGPSSRRSSFLQAIFKGHPVKPKHKDLGDWRPVPAPPSLTHADVKTTASSGASSSDDHRPISAGSQAEAALAAVHRSSPPALRAGQIKSPNLPAIVGPQDKENVKQPLGVKSPNLALSPLSLEFDPNQTKSAPSTRHHSRSLTISPPLLHIPPDKNTNPNNHSLTTLPIEENISFTRRVPPFNMPRVLPLNKNFNMTQSDVLPMAPPYLPTGYASQPMSRDGSRESNYSLATAPAGPGATSLSPTVTYSYLHRAGPTSTDALAASYSSNNLSRIGDWAVTSTSPTGSAPLAPAISLDGAGPGVVQFGSASPVNIYEARTRAEEYARRLMPFEKGAFRPNRARAPASPGLQPASSNDNEVGVRGLGLKFT